MENMVTAASQHIGLSNQAADIVAGRPSSRSKRLPSYLATSA
jgi:hypothetical protein